MRAKDSVSALHLSYALAALYWWNCEKDSVPAVMTKVSSTALLAYHAYKTATVNQPRHKVTALICHCVGDLLIELPGNPILYAIPAFFLGHSFYISTLLKNRKPLSELNLSQKWMLAAFGLYAAGFTFLLMSKTSDVIQCAIPIYSTVLSAMFVLACVQKQNAFRIFLGALMYVVSDNIIGADRFLQKIPGINYVTWPLYFFGQSMLVARSAVKNINIITPTIDFMRE